MQSEAKLKIAIEASNDKIWYKYIGSDGLFIGVEDFMYSAPGQELYEKAGFTAKEIIKKIAKKLSKK